MAYVMRPSTGEYAPFEEAYVDRVPDGDILATLEREGEAFLALVLGIPEKRADTAYAPGKWTIRDVVGHVSDAERIMAYRALRFARGDGTPLPGFDENAYVPAAGFGGRGLASLGDEFEAVRRATVKLFAGLPAEAWERTGIASGKPHSVRALAYVIAGHGMHHREILRTRYLTAIPAGG
jgi:hypothetical protein